MIAKSLPWQAPVPSRDDRNPCSGIASQSPRASRPGPQSSFALGTGTFRCRMLGTSASDPSRLLLGSSGDFSDGCSRCGPRGKLHEEINALAEQVVVALGEVADLGTDIAQVYYQIRACTPGLAAVYSMLRQGSEGIEESDSGGCGSGNACGAD